MLQKFIHEEHPVIIPDSFCHQKLFWHNVHMPSYLAGGTPSDSSEGIADAEYFFAFLTFNVAFLTIYEKSWGLPDKINFVNFCFFPCIVFKQPN